MYLENSELRSILGLPDEKIKGRNKMNRNVISLYLAKLGLIIF